MIRSTAPPLPPRDRDLVTTWTGSKMNNMKNGHGTLTIHCRKNSDTVYMYMGDMVNDKKQGYGTETDMLNQRICCGRWHLGRFVAGTVMCQGYFYASREFSSVSPVSYRIGFCERVAFSSNAEFKFEGNVSSTPSIMDKLVGHDCRQTLQILNNILNREIENYMDRQPVRQLSFRSGIRNVTRESRESRVQPEPDFSFPDLAETSFESETSSFESETNNDVERQQEEDLNTCIEIVSSWEETQEEKMKDMVVDYCESYHEKWADFAFLEVLDKIKSQVRVSQPIVPCVIAPSTNTATTNTCKLCYTNPISIRLSCGHTGCCETCCANLRDRKCPWCRATFTSVRKVMIVE
jgi:hypothetical protein